MPSLSVVIPVVIVVLVIAIIFLTGYVKASPDTALIISGMRKKPKVLIGKAGVKIPFLERKDELNLQLIPIDVKTSTAVPTADYINIRVDATVNVKISDNEERLKLAAQNFLNKKPDYIGGVAREVLEGNVREIVGKMAQRMWDASPYDVKVYLTASVETRAKRRYDELTAKGEACDLDEIARDIKERDERDMNRETAPLRQAEDAVLVDSSDMTIEEVVKEIAGLCR